MSVRHRRRRFIANVAGWGRRGWGLFWCLQRRGVPSLVIRRVGIFDGFLPTNIEWREQGELEPRDSKGDILAAGYLSLFTKARIQISHQNQSRAIS